MASGDAPRLLIANGDAAATLDELPPLIRALIESASNIQRAFRIPMTVFEIDQAGRVAA